LSLNFCNIGLSM